MSTFRFSDWIEREIDSESCYIKPNLDCDYTFLIDLAPNGISFGAKSIETSISTIQIWFDLTRHLCSLRSVSIIKVWIFSIWWSPLPARMLFETVMTFYNYFLLQLIIFSCLCCLKSILKTLKRLDSFVRYKFFFCIFTCLVSIKRFTILEEVYYAIRINRNFSRLSSLW